MATDLLPKHLLFSLEGDNDSRFVVVVVVVVVVIVVCFVFVCIYCKSTDSIY